MYDAYIESILSGCEIGRYPEGFLTDFEALECFAHSDLGETLLVKNRKTGERFVAKCYFDNTLLSHVTEGDILKSLNYPGLPGFAGEYQNDGMLCVIREYVEGMPLNQYTTQCKLNEPQAVEFAMALCDILSYLHRQTPPVIHRDIKPQNLIVDKQGRLFLIDFGISRVYDETSGEDTVCYGTKNFAAPEQYGFSQTDRRTDIFSFGVLLGWLLTGESELARILPKVTNPRLLRIVKKCTAFAPEKRYTSVEKVKAVLINADGHRQKRARRIIFAFLACVACLCAGFAIGRYTEYTPVYALEAGVLFEEPLVEQAVRLVLNKTMDEPIDETDLLSVTELYIYGDKVANSAEAFEVLGEHMAKNDGVLKNGGLHSIKDLKKLKNLRILRVALEDIEDLSPLSGLFALELVDLRHNPILDALPLATLPALKELCLYDTRVDDLSSLSACPFLTAIHAGKTYITSIAALRGIKNLKSLSLRDAPLTTLSGIEEFTYLEKIDLTDVTDKNLKPLLALERLKEASLSESLRQQAEKDLVQAGFIISYK